MDDPLIIDAHSHVHEPVRHHIALLDEAGADRAVLFSTRPHPERATDLASFRREMSVLHETVGGEAGGADGHRAAGEELVAACAAYPDRFIGFGKVRLDRPAERIAAEVEREVVGRGFRGIGELTPPPERAGLVEPVLRAASDHGGSIAFWAAPSRNCSVSDRWDVCRSGRVSGGCGGTDG
ncbi:amidohydrolase family protein [Streptomyces nojiriensis]|uniref:amidohydrolase family protein n=1 Tax=Streptomyces nojiriensis TaxID=66374 RepID=UPI003658EC03